MAVTRAQMIALDLATEGDLVRWPGGFWALANEHVASTQPDGTKVPARWVAAGTIYALDRKHLLQELGPGETHPWSGPRRITGAGRVAIAPSPQQQEMK